MEINGNLKVEKSRNRKTVKLRNQNVKKSRNQKTETSKNLEIRKPKMENSEDREIQRNLGNYRICRQGEKLTQFSRRKGIEI